MSILTIKKASDCGFRFRLPKNFLQIENFASDYLNISFKSKISLQITDFSSNRSTRDAVMSDGLQSPLFWKGELWLEPPYFELMEENMNQPFQSPGLMEEPPNGTHTINIYPNDVSLSSHCYWENIYHVHLDNSKQNHW